MTYQKMGLYPIVYSDERYDATEHFAETLMTSINNLYGNIRPYFLPDELFYVKAFSYKGLDWQYENEWRLIYSCKEAVDISINEVLRPKAIFLGSEISKSNVNIIKKLIAGKGMIVYHMFKNIYNSKYVLDCREINI